MPAELLHQGQGLKIVRNERNQFIIASLHYSANPAKRSPEWVREAKAGMDPAKAAREYELDYTATIGAKAFPELSQKHDSIVVEPFDVPGHLRCWGGFDYGTRNPAAFEVFTILDDCIYCIWELYEPCKNIPDFIEKMRACPYWKQLRYIAADPSLWIPNQQQAAGQPIGIADIYFNLGVRNFMRGRADGQAEDAWIAMLRQHWQLGEPTFRIFNNCINLAREFESAIYEPQSERQLLGGVYKECLQDRDNHALDATKYFMLSRPPMQAPATLVRATIDNRWAQRPGAVGRKPVGGYR